MSEALTKPGSLGVTSRYDDDVFNSLTIQGGFLPRIQLYTGKSKLVEKDLFKANHWGIVKGKDKIEDLGPTFVAYPLADRPMALDITGKKAVSYYNPTTPQFRATLEGSADPNSGMMAGMQFLLFIQGHAYATLFCANKSAKMMAPGLKKLKENFVQFGSHTVDTGKFVYRAPDVTLSNVVFELPPLEELKKKVQEFVNVAAVVETDKDLENVEDNLAKQGVPADPNGRAR